METTEIRLKNFTRDTTPELALFLNIALDRMNNLLKLYEGKPVDISKMELKGQVFKKETYLHLKTFFWKEKVSVSFAQIKAADISVLNTVLAKLVDLRNFHSHFYHDSAALQFPDFLIKHIQLQFENVKTRLAATQQNFAEYIKTLEEDITEFTKPDGTKRTDRYKHFDFFTPAGEITEQGKNFFLSFFLLKGEMNKFLKKRKRCKRDNGEKYQVKNSVLTELCHRDNSNRFFLAGKAEYYDERELLRRQFNTILNYLKSKPVVDREYLPPTKEMPLYSRYEMEERKELRLEQAPAEITEEKEVIRRSDKFMNIAIRYFMDRAVLGHADEKVIEWAVKDYNHETVQKAAAENITNEDSKTYLKRPAVFSESFKPGFFPHIKNNHIKFKIKGSDIEYIINEREVKNWLYYLLNVPRKTWAETVSAIEAYGAQWVAAINELNEKDNITFTNYPLMFGVEGNKKKILSAAHHKVLSKEAFDEHEYRRKISARMVNTIAYLQGELLKTGEYNRNKKHRLILKCFNWFLTKDSMLKPDEVNRLSIYNFVAETKLSAQTRESIIQPILQKLQSAQNGTFKLMQSAKSLDELYTAMLNAKIEALQQANESLANTPLEMLHTMAGKLRVTLPGSNVSKTGTGRQSELKETLIKKPVLIQNGFFKSIFDPTGKVNISARIRKNKAWQALLIEDHYRFENQNEFINGDGGEGFKKDISPEVVTIVGQHYERLFNTYSTTGSKQPFSAFVQLFMQQLSSTDEAARAQVVKALNLYKVLNEEKVKDALLAQILFEYHHTEMPLAKRELQHVNIAALYENTYELRIDKHKTIELNYKQLDDLATFWDRDKIAALLNNTEYWNDKLLAELEEKSPKSDQQKILIQMNRVFEDSFYYLKVFLQTEEKIIKLNQTNIQALINDSKAVQKEKRRQPGMERIEPEVILKKVKRIDTDDKVEKFVKARQSAFHTDVPGDNIKYAVVKDELAELAGLPKPVAKDKNKYKKDKK